MPADLKFENRPIKMAGALQEHQMQFKNAIVKEGLSKLSETTVEFLSSDHSVDLQDILGTLISITVDTPNGERFFSGYCVSVEFVGLYQGLSHFVAELRPWLWFLTRAEEHRIYQDKSSVDIITEIFGDYGFSTHLSKKLNETYEKRTYCVQYGETDYNFVCRLMEEEGIYFFFDYTTSGQKIILADGVSAHTTIKGVQPLEFHYQELGGYRRRNDHVFEWNEHSAVTSGKVTLNDYDFESPRADQKKVNTISKGKHSYKSYEKYQYPGHVRPPTNKDSFARVRMEAEAVKHLVRRGACNVRDMAVGYTFTLSEHPRAKNNIEYLIIDATHHLQIESDYEDAETKTPLIDNRVPVDDSNKDTYRCVFDVIPQKEPFRAPHVATWPSISGLQTALVTGPSGDEIYTDEFGRIKVQFHWDRVGKKDENTTCWVRCVMPWTGKNWGMVSIPRIGNEVVVQFEEGDPDRPICTGMLYNADNKPPFALPANMTQSGIKTRSTKSGSTDTFNELVFEDKKDAEFVRMQSEKDYTQIIKNNAEITIGAEKKDPGDLTQTIYNTKTETIQQGDHIFKVETGNQDVYVKTNHTETIEGKVKQTITGDNVQKVKEGDYTQTIDSGDVTREVSMGNETHTICMGDFTMDVSAGSVAITAGMEISLTVGGNSVVIDNSGVSISGVMVSIAGDASAEMDSPSTTVSGALVTIDGSTTMIN